MRLRYDPSRLVWHERLVRYDRAQACWAPWHWHHAPRVMRVVSLGPPDADGLRLITQWQVTPDRYRSWWGMGS